VRLSIEVEGQEGMSWDEFVAVARRVEAAGLDGLYRSDHYLTFLHQSTQDAHDSWASIAALSVLTTRIRLGTIVSAATFRHPSNLARMVATIDHISGGRIDLGIGAAWNAREHAAYGFPFDDARTRLSRLAEQIEIIVRSWTEDRFSFDGSHYTLSGCEALPKPVQKPHPPIVLGGFGRPRAAALAARWAQEYNSVYGTVDDCRERRRNLDDACRALGRDPATLPLSLMARCMLGRDRSEADERVARMRALDRGFDTAMSASPRGSESALIGTVDEVATRLAQLEHAGVSRVVLHHIDHRDLEMIDLVGAELVPALS
jgi:F420-dependent oxidoreductase-like protein